MTDHRAREHPILPVPEAEPRVPFYWNGKRLLARAGEVISSALFAAGIHTFGRHPRDGSPLGIFCANGQCAQCTVIANGVALKSCMVPVAENMVVESCDRTPGLPVLDESPTIGATPVTRTESRPSSSRKSPIFFWVMGSPIWTADVGEPSSSASELKVAP